MKSILSKLSPEEIKELSKALNKQQKKNFGNPLSLRKQEQMMADLFGVKNWSTLLGSSKKEYDEKAKYHKTIIQVEVLSDCVFNDGFDLMDLHNAITDGDCSGKFEVISRESLSQSEMATELQEQGSDPSFLIMNDFSTDKVLVFEYLMNILQEENRKIYIEETSDVLAKELIRLFKQERDDAIRKYNRLNSDDELDTLSEVEAILAKDIVDFDEDEFIIMLRD